VLAPSPPQQLQPVSQLQPAPQQLQPVSQLQPAPQQQSPQQPQQQQQSQPQMTKSPSLLLRSDPVAAALAHVQVR